MGVPRELPGGSWGPSGVRRESVGGVGRGGPFIVQCLGQKNVRRESVEVRRDPLGSVGVGVGIRGVPGGLWGSIKGPLGVRGGVHRGSLRGHLLRNA